jgi:hypothetical protein
MYKLGTLSMSNFLNLPLQERLGPRTSMILIIIFCTKNTLPVVVDEPLKILS